MDFLLIKKKKKKKTGSSHLKDSAAHLSSKVRNPFVSEGASSASHSLGAVARKKKVTYLHYY